MCKGLPGAAKPVSLAFVQTRIAFESLVLPSIPSVQYLPGLLLLR